MSCSRSIRLSELVPEPPESVHAAGGTAAHELGEKCLKSGQGPFEFIGEKIDGFEVNDDMAEAVSMYVDFCRSLKGEMEIEKRFNLGWIHKDIFGTSDCSVYNREKKTLFVTDYKHGKGIVVSPEWNSQLMIYGLGASRGVEGLEMIVLTIVQPRAHHDDGPIRSWAISKSDLYAWAFDVLKPAAIRTESGDAPILAGSHCRFCKAIAVCPAQATRALEIAKTDFNNPILPEPDKLTPETIVKVLDLASAFSSWADKVRAYAKSRLEIGEDIPGYKLVARRSNRRWASGKPVEDILKTYLGEAAFKKTLISPAQAERSIKKCGLDPKAVKEVLEPIWEKPDAGTTIAPSEDKRTAVAIPVVNDFLDNIDFLK